MKKAMAILLLLAIILVAGCSTNQTPPTATTMPAATPSVSTTPPATTVAPTEPSPPADEPANNDWAFDTPDSQGVDGALLDDLHRAIADMEFRSVVIARNGVIISEYYKDGYDEATVFNLASCTKSFSGALIGIALREGILSGIDQRLPEFFPEIAHEAGKNEVTVEHFLTHTSGISWSEWAGGTMFRQFTSSENWVNFVLEQPMAAQPGTVFNYTTGGSHMLAAILQKASGQTAFDLGRQYLFAPLGMDSVGWRADPQGITDGGNGISMTARDAAKFGQLYLNGGLWHDEQIIPAQWVAESTITQAGGSPGTGTYGYSWWLKSFSGYDAYYAMGHGGQYIFVVPELALVTVVTSRFQDTYLPQYYFNDYIVAACR